MLIRCTKSDIDFLYKKNLHNRFLIQNIGYLVHKNWFEI